MYPPEGVPETHSRCPGRNLSSSGHLLGDDFGTLRDSVGVLGINRREDV